MKKVQAIDEAGRSMAQRRYGDVANKSDYGHSQMGHNMAHKFETGGMVPSAPKKDGDSYAD